MTRCRCANIPVLIGEGLNSSSDLYAIGDKMIGQSSDVFDRKRHMADANLVQFYAVAVRLVSRMASHNKELRLAPVQVYGTAIVALVLVGVGEPSGTSVLHEVFGNFHAKDVPIEGQSFVHVSDANSYMRDSCRFHIFTFYIESFCRLLRFVKTEQSVNQGTRNIYAT